MKHAISWFEIPTIDIDRATRFYEAVFQVSLVPMETPNLKMRMFPVDDPMDGIGGALCQAEGFYHPSLSHGPLIYLNGNPDVQLFLDRVVSEGGKVHVPKTEISPEYGHMAVFEDTEGNRIALHSVPPVA